MTGQRPVLPDIDLPDTDALGPSGSDHAAESLTDLIDRIQRDAFRRWRPRPGVDRYSGPEKSAAARAD
jgi:hypothetical protein